MDKIICIGKNYLDHAKELGDTVPEKPVIFLKPPSVLVQVLNEKLSVALPDPTLGQMHPECEIVVRISKHIFRVAPSECADAYDALTLGLDGTLRDLQSKLKKAGHPWEIAKIFPGAAVIGKWILKADFVNFATPNFEYLKNDSVTQTANATQMRFSIEECIAHASQYFELLPGDIVFTGTPEGVSAVGAGDQSTVRWGKQLEYSVNWR